MNTRPVHILIVLGVAIAVLAATPNLLAAANTTLTGTPQGSIPATMLHKPAASRTPLIAVTHRTMPLPALPPRPNATLVAQEIPPVHPLVSQLVQDLIAYRTTTTPARTATVLNDIALLVQSNTSLNGTVALLVNGTYLHTALVPRNGSGAGMLITLLEHNETTATLWRFTVRDAPLSVRELSGKRLASRLVADLDALQDPTATRNLTEIDIADDLAGLQESNLLRNGTTTFLVDGATLNITPGVPLGNTMVNGTIISLASPDTTVREFILPDRPLPNGNLSTSFPNGTAPTVALDVNAPARAHIANLSNQTGWNGPRIINATIWPSAVHVGDTQHLSVTVTSTAPLQSVVAIIQTDDGTISHTLQPTREYPATEFRYTLGAWTIATGGPDMLFGMLRHLPLVQAEPLTRTYTGSWNVTRTHDAFYNTTFIASDQAGKTDAITVAWSDACGIPASGSWTMYSSCDLSATDGVDNGNVYLNQNNYCWNPGFGWGYWGAYCSTLTVHTGTTFVWNAGKSITINTNNQITVHSAGGQLKKTNLWMMDADSDGCPKNSTQVASDNSPGAGYRRRYLLDPSCTDCDDNNAAVQALTTWYRDADGDGYGTSSWTTTSCYQPGGYVSSSGDCCDYDANANPGSSYCGTSPLYFCSGYDYNCDGQETTCNDDTAWAMCVNDGYGNCALYYGGAGYGDGTWSCWYVSGQVTCLAGIPSFTCGASQEWDSPTACSGSWPNGCTVIPTTSTPTVSCQ